SDFKLSSVTRERDALQAEVDAIPALNASIAELEAATAGLEADIAERDDDIHALNQKLEWCSDIHGGVPDDFAEQSSVAGVRAGPHTQGMGVSPKKGRSLSSEVADQIISQIEPDESDEEDRGEGDRLDVERDEEDDLDEERDEEDEQDEVDNLAEDLASDAADQDFLVDDYQHISSTQLHFSIQTIASTSPITASLPTGPIYADAATNTVPALTTAPAPTPVVPTITAAAKKSIDNSGSYLWHLIQALLIFVLLLWTVRTYQLEQLWLGANDVTRLHVLNYRRYSNAHGLM
ncbi:hypothetical protein LTS18_013115, partial [Coniosporium uncinatum]